MGNPPASMSCFAWLRDFISERRDCRRFLVLVTTAAKKKRRFLGGQREGDAERSYVVPAERQSSAGFSFWPCASKSALAASRRASTKGLSSTTRGGLFPLQTLRTSRIPLETKQDECMPAPGRRASKSAPRAEAHRRGRGSRRSACRAIRRAVPATVSPPPTRAPRRIARRPCGAAPAPAQQRGRFHTCAYV